MDTDYELRLDQYNQDLRVSISTSRQVILQHLKHTFSSDPTQPTLRRLSWTFSYEWQQHFSLRTQTTKLLKYEGAQMPFGIASSRQDKYHHNHLINAFLLSILKPEATVRLEPYTTNVSTCCLGSTEETTRLEEMDKLYLHLRSKVPEQSNLMAESKITLGIINEELKRQGEELTQCTQILKKLLAKRPGKKTTK